MKKISSFRWKTILRTAKRNLCRIWS